MIVDDEVALGLIFKKLLISNGLQVDVVINGQDAITKTKEKKYDFIFTDLNMPVMGGNEFVSELRKDGKFVGKIFLISGVTNFNETQIDVDGVLQKPIDMDIVYKLLTKD